MRSDPLFQEKRQRIGPGIVLHDRRGLLCERHQTAGIVPLASEGNESSRRVWIGTLEHKDAMSLDPLERLQNEAIPSGLHEAGLELRGSAETPPITGVSQPRIVHAQNSGDREPGRAEESIEDELVIVET